MSSSSDASLLALVLPRLIFGTPPGPTRALDLTRYSSGSDDNVLAALSHAVVSLTHAVAEHYIDDAETALTAIPGSSLSGPINEPGTGLSISLPVWNASVRPDPDSGAMPERALIVRFNLHRFAVRVLGSTPAFMNAPGQSNLTWLRADGSDLRSWNLGSESWDNRAGAAAAAALVNDYVKEGRRGHSVDLPVL